MSLFPTDDKQRKAIPLFKYFTRYFPKAHREVTKVCVANNVRYNPDRDPFDINWARGKSPDQLGSAFRHMMEAEVDGKVFEELPPEVAKVVGFDKVYVLAEAMWRLGAELELTIEKVESALGAAATLDPLICPRCHANGRVTFGLAASDWYCHECKRHFGV
jgi:hypothetical protein